MSVSGQYIWLSIQTPSIVNRTRDNIIPAIVHCVPTDMNYIQICDVKIPDRNEFVCLFVYSLFKGAVSNAV
jgi:hypothetical protein